MDDEYLGARSQLIVRLSTASRARGRAGGAASVIAGAITLLLLGSGSGCSGQTHSEIDAEREGVAEECRGAALDIAKWLEHTAIRTQHGIRWPRAPDAKLHFDEQGRVLAGGAQDANDRDDSLYSGSAGVLLFFVELMASSSDRAERQHLFELLVAGGDELLEALPDQCSGEGCGLYTGIAGAGFALEEIARATSERRFHDGALRCVDVLHASARVAGSGIEWSDTTDVIAGSAGIGCFLLDMHAHLHEREYAAVALELSTRAGRRLLDLARRESVGRSWRMDTTFPRVMPNFSHGTAGVAFFLARLYDATNEPAFLDAARDGADHLLSIADLSNGGCLVGHDTPDQPTLHYLGWCHGPCGTARLFAELARLTGERRYADAAKRCLHSVVASGIPTAPHPGFWNNVGVCCGSAGVVEFLLGARRDLDETRDAESHRFLLAVVDDLLARGTRDERGLRFVQAEHRVKPELLEAQTGLMQGAAGVGLALLHLEESERRRAAAVVLPDVPRTWRGVPSP